jgi:hypothetical protein
MAEGLKFVALTFDFDKDVKNYPVVLDKNIGFLI